MVLSLRSIDKSHHRVEDLSRRISHLALWTQRNHRLGVSQFPPMGLRKTCAPLTFPAQLASEGFSICAAGSGKGVIWFVISSLTVVVYCGNLHLYSSAIIEHVISLCVDRQTSMMYFYFDFRDKEKQNIRNLVTSLLIQLSAFSDPCCDVISGVYSAHGNGTRQLTNDVLTKCLADMLAVVVERRIYVVTDALDECPGPLLPLFACVAAVFTLVTSSSL